MPAMDQLSTQLIFCLEDEGDEKLRRTTSLESHSR